MSYTVLAIFLLPPIVRVMAVTQLSEHLDRAVKIDKLLGAEDPVEALRLAAATPTIHLLRTDFSMPEAIGLELARRFRNGDPKTPVLMVSGSLEAINGRTDDLDRFKVLARPFASEEPVDQVCAWLNDSITHHVAASP